MKKLLKDVKKNRICLDFQRIMIEIRIYLNQIFPSMGICFIVLNDHYDSREYHGSTIEIDTAFQILLYDLYSKDISVKVKTSFKNKYADGEYVFRQVLFGYEKSKEVKNTVVVNEKEAGIVQYFTKSLFLLIPFYIFSHEKDFGVYNSDEQRLAELQAEYQDILKRLDKPEQEEVIGAFDKRTIIELSGDVIKEIAQKYENVQKGIGEMMGGALIETEARTILNKGKAEGRNETKKKTALRMLQDGELPIDKIAKYAGLDIAEVELLAGVDTV
ncbi:hypothetical protein AALC25_10470 [Lachnospiraceae bacterium 29-84]